MPRQFLLQTGVTAGEFSPRLYGRPDVEQYKNAFELLRNAYALPQGPITKRPGSQHIGPSYNENEGSKLVNFVFSVDEAYVMEFGAGYIQIYRNRGKLLSSAAITNGDFPADIAGWTDVSVGTGSIAHNTDHMDIISGTAGNEGIAEQQIDYVGIEQYTLTLDVAVNTVTVRIGTTSGASDVLADTIVAVGAGQTVTFTPAAAGTVYLQIENHNNSTTAEVDNISLDTPVLTLDSPYTEAEALSLDFTQSSDVLFLTVGTKPIHTLTREGPSEWTLREVDTLDGPYDRINKDETKTLKPSATTGTVTITAVGHEPFEVGDEGRWIRIGYLTGPSGATEWGAAQITTVTSSTLVTAEVDANFPFTLTATTFRWRLGQWSDAQGWPYKCGFYEQRFVTGRTDKYPDTIWTTESQGYDADELLMSPTNADGQVVASNAINTPVAAGQSNAIEWISGGNVLAVGTAGAELILEGPDLSKALAPDNNRVIIGTTAGSKEDVRPVRVNGQLLFAQSVGFKVNEFLFSFEKDAYIAKDITILSEHITRPGITQSAYCKDPFSVVWWLLDDGSLAALTYVAEQEVGGWSRHTISGSFGATAHAVVEDIVAIPSEDNVFTELWMKVKRTIDGVTRRYLEVMDRPYFQGVEQEATYSDSYLIYDGAPTSTITGLDHLEGEEVTILAEGAVEALQTVSGGQITLEDDAEYVVIGLPIKSQMRTLSWEAPNVFGSSFGNIKRNTNICVLVYETQGLKVGRDEDNLTIQPDRAPSGLMDTAPALYSGWLDFAIIGGWGKKAQIYMEHDLPVPFTINAIAVKGKSNEG